MTFQKDGINKEVSCYTYIYIYTYTDTKKKKREKKQWETNFIVYNAIVLHYRLSIVQFEVHIKWR